ncbi:unnamed protein product [Leptosia nina]|uniref:Uncharacterized protein n=1 Tax=Leptosia nina TaxID=320188 RepID=A0AAV1J3E7_9NEOP
MVERVNSDAIMSRGCAGGHRSPPLAERRSVRSIAAYASELAARGRYPIVVQLKQSYRQIKVPISALLFRV